MSSYTVKEDHIGSAVSFKFRHIKILLLLYKDNSDYWLCLIKRLVRSFGTERHTDILLLYYKGNSNCWFYLIPAFIYK